MNIRKLILLLLVSFGSFNISGQNQDSLAVINATKNFVKAFTGFDWQTFKNSFSSDATIFFPVWEKGKRKSGRKEIESTWADIFPEFIDTTKKFDLKIEPKDILMQLYDKTAIVSFHLGGGDYLSRRTIVFVKEGQEWKIVHLHASSVSKEKSNN